MSAFEIYLHYCKLLDKQRIDFNIAGHVHRMAKGKHRPAPGAIRPDKVLHPQSRKVAKLHKKENRKFKVSNTVSVGAKRLEILGEKLQWFHDNLALVSEEEEVAVFTKPMLLRYVTCFKYRHLHVKWDSNYY